MSRLIIYGIWNLLLKIVVAIIVYRYLHSWEMGLATYLVLQRYKTTTTPVTKD